jgi:drug/metabolite transporter (DMT)-like permease
VTVVLLAAFAGVLLGGLTVAARWGARREADAEIGALVAAVVGAAASLAIAAPSIARHAPDVSSLFPFFAAGLLAPGASQILFTVAVADAGASRAAMFMGTAPLLSILIAVTLLGEPFHVVLVAGALLIVIGGVVLASERTRPQHFRMRGVALALACAALFAARDNVIRWGAQGEHPRPALAAAGSLLVASALILVYAALRRRRSLGASFLRALPAFAPAGVVLALGYEALLAALGRGRVSLVSPLTATGSLWAVLLAALVLGRSESIGRRSALAAVLVVAGGGVIGAYS